MANPTTDPASATPGRPRLTRSQHTALSLLRNWRSGLSARAFASIAYPEAFARVSPTGRSGRGILRGAGASLRAGGFLRRLLRLGLVDAEVSRDSGLVTYRVSELGLAAIEEAEKPRPKPPKPEDPVVADVLRRWR